MALRRVFTYLGALFLMSHIVMCVNTYAVEFSVPVSFVKGYGYPYWSDNNGRSYGQGRYDYGTNFDYASSSAQYFRTDSNTALTTTAGQYVSLTGVIIISVTSQSQAVSIQANPRQYFGMVGSSSSVDCPLIDLEETAFQQSQSAGTTWMLRYNITSVCRVKSNTTNNVAMNFSLNGGSTSGTDYLRFVPVYIGVWKAQTGFDDSDIISAINSLSTAIANLGTKIDGLGNKIDNINNESAEATQDASDSAETEANTSSSDAESGTASLINTIGSAVSAITSASPTNCLLNGNMGNFDMGQIDLCANPVPAFVQIIGSLILILVTVPLCIVLFNRFIGLFRSFQG